MEAEREGINPDSITEYAYFEGFPNSWQVIDKSVLNYQKTSPFFKMAASQEMEGKVCT